MTLAPLLNVYALVLVLIVSGLFSMKENILKVFVENKRRLVVVVGVGFGFGFVFVFDCFGGVGARS